MKKLAIVFLAISGLFMACDDDPVTVDTEAPVIDGRLSFNNPNCMPCEGETLNIHFTITDNDELHDIEAFLQQSFMDGIQDYSNAQPEKLYELDAHSHTSVYTVDTTYVVDTIHHSTFYLIVNASDHNGNEATDTTKLHAHM